MDATVVHVDISNSNSVGAVQVAACNNQSKPEWLRIPEAVRLFGICRSSLYVLITAGKIKSTCLRKRGAVRGIRIINFDSLAAYIESQAAAGGNE